jgi:hypothetical protein
MVDTHPHDSKTDYLVPILGRRISTVSVLVRRAWLVQ